MQHTVFTIFFVLFHVSCLLAQPVLTPDIDVDELRAHVGMLASEEFQGRRPGTLGGEMASEYIHEQLRALGIRLLYDEGYQSFSIVRGVEEGENCALRFNGFEAKRGRDFRPLAFSASTSLAANVVFVGYGFDFEKDGVSWRDYAGLEIEGAWVLLLRGSPDEKDAMYEPHVSLRAKALKAQDNGAAGVLFVAGPVFQEKDETVALKYQPQDAAMAIPVISITRSIADRMLAGTTLAKLEATLNESRSPLRADCDATLDATVDLRQLRITGRNIVAMIEGSDSTVSDEYIVLGAHYDHLGLGGHGSGSRRPDTTAVHFGADDNASGVSAVIEIAERIALSGDEFRRSVIVALFDAEEMGLLGSKEFTNNPPVDPASMILMCNLDMVGRLDTADAVINIGGTGTADGLDGIVERVGASHGLRVSMSPEGFGPSDHASFYAKDIPVLFFFTGVHEDYHTPFDAADRLNYEGKKRVADMVYDIVHTVANNDERLAFQEAGPKSRPSGEQRFKVTLGIMPDVSGGDGKGLRADAVIPGRPAALGGMKKGDVIVAMEGRAVTNVYDYMSRLGEFSVGQRISVEVMREGEKLVLIVEL